MQQHRSRRLLWLHRHVGYRGRVLLLLGIVWLLVGLSTILDPQPVRVARALVHESLPLTVRAVLWTGCGLIAICYAFTGPLRDRWGYVALMVPAAWRAMSYLASWLLWAAPFGPVGWSGAWLGAIVWTAVMALVLVEADRPEMPVAVVEEGP